MTLRQLGLEAQVSKARSYFINLVLRFRFILHMMVMRNLFLIWKEFVFHLKINNSVGHILKSFETVKSSILYACLFCW